MPFRQNLLFVSTLLLCSAASLAGQAPEYLKPDERFKADILVVVAHPDDETMVTGYLAKAIYDEKKRVAVVFGNRGNGGGNAAGNEQSAALGAEREIEGRNALANLGITNVWFLNGLDTPSQDVLNSLETWNHGDCLGQLVRLVRLTRPEIILTWLPAFVAGENHGDHQAAGVLATEAFDLAGDWAAFPEQVSAPRERQGLSNLTEGLHPWQTKKIYYFTDAADPKFQDGHGPTYSTDGTSPSRGIPYYRLSADEMSPHLTQDDTGQMAVQAIAKADFSYFRQPIRLILGKSLVGGTTTGDIFEKIDSHPLEFTPPVRVKSSVRSGYSIELGGSWFFYREFRKAHALTHIDEFVPTLDTQVGPGRALPVPINLRNDTDSPGEITLTVNAPTSWEVMSKNLSYPVRAREIYSLRERITVPPGTKDGTYDLEFKAQGAGKDIGTIRLRVHTTSGAMPQ